MGRSASSPSVASKKSVFATVRPAGLKSSLDSWHDSMWTLDHAPVEPTPFSDMRACTWIPNPSTTPTAGCLAPFRCAGCLGHVWVPSVFEAAGHEDCLCEFE